MKDFQFILTICLLQGKLLSFIHLTKSNKLLTMFDQKSSHKERLILETTQIVGTGTLIKLNKNFICQFVSLLLVNLLEEEQGSSLLQSTIQLLIGSSLGPKMLYLTSQLNFWKMTTLEMKLFVKPLSHLCQHLLRQSTNYQLNFIHNRKDMFTQLQNLSYNLSSSLRVCSVKKEMIY